MSRSVYRRIRALAGRRVDRASRREFLAASLAGAAGLMLPGASLAQGRQASGRRVVVVGAGFAGLACAHELIALGCDVTVVEARDQVGGRVRSTDQFVKGRTVEVGAELIGINHPTWMRFQKELGLELIELSEDETLEQPVWLDGRRLSSEEAARLLEEMDEVFVNMDFDAKTVVEDEPWTTPGAKELDARSTQDWLDKVKASDLCKRALEVEFYANNGQALPQQSYLGNLCQVKGGGGAQHYRDDSETHRCKGGNQRLASALAAKIGADRVLLGLPVTRIDHGKRDVTVHCKDGRTISCDEVVVAVPPSVWSKIEFAPGLPRLLVPQMGKNVKFFVPLKTRFWKQLGSEQYALGDGRVSMTWEGTDGQEGDGDVVMVAFSGARAAEACIALPREERDKAYLDELERLYPGIKDQVTGKAFFMDWTSESWTQASYSFPKPGEVTTIGPILHRGLGRLHFAGEHTCYKFVGYMEGALYSGVSVARRIVTREAAPGR
jgi:monoamine oxidase